MATILLEQERRNSIIWGYILLALKFLAIFIWNIQVEKDTSYAQEMIENNLLHHVK